VRRLGHDGGPVNAGRRRGLGVELKPSYYRQAVKNLDALEGDQYEQETWLSAAESDVMDEVPA